DHPGCRLRAPAPRKLRAPLEPGRSQSYGCAGRETASTTWKAWLTWTSSSVPSLVLMCDSYGALPSVLVSVRSIVAFGYLASTAASTLDLVSPVSGVSGLWPPGPPRPPGPAWSACTAVAWNDAFTSTTSSLPPDVLMCA